MGWECPFSDNKQVGSAAGQVAVLRERKKIKTPTDSRIHFVTETTFKSSNFSILFQSKGITLVLTLFDK